MKRKQQYTDEDFARLEGLMYDKFHVSLNSTQVCRTSLLQQLSLILSIQLLMGDDLDLCLAALTSSEHTSNHPLHVLERIDIDFAVQMSIVADAVSLTRFKVSGKLPTLAVNISNAKYKGVMRMIDIAIPHFENDDNAKGTTRPLQRPIATNPSKSFFSRGAQNTEYTIEDDGATTVADSDDGEEEFFEAEEDETQVNPQTFLMNVQAC